MNKIAFLLVTALSLSACGGGGGGGGDTKKQPDPSYDAPTITVAAPSTVPEQAAVELSASIAFDNASLKTVTWSQVSGMSVNITADNESASFTAPVVLMQQGVQTLEFEVSVIDTNDNSSAETVQVQVQPTNLTPVITMNVAESIAELEDFEFDASATDNDGDIVSYQWSTDFQGLNIVNANSLTATFTAPAVNSTTEIKFTLTATDNEAEVSEKDILVTVNPTISGTIIGTDFNPISTNALIIEERDVIIYDFLTNQEIARTKPETDGSYSVMLIGDQSLSNGFKVVSQENISVDGESTEANPDLEAVCFADERHNCLLTPISLLITKAIENEEDITTRAQAVEHLENALNIDLSSDPFISGDGESGVDTKAIQLALLSDEITVPSWINSVFGFVNGKQDDAAVIATYFVNADVARIGVIISSDAIDLTAKEFNIVELVANVSLFGAEDSGQIYNYQWTLPEGFELTVDEDDTTSSSIRIKMPDVEVDTDLTFAVNVNNDDFNSDADITLTVQPVDFVDNTAPAINTMKDRIFNENSDVSITAFASDGQDFSSQLDVSWTQVEGTSVTLDTTNDFTLEFKTPDVIDDIQKLVFKITVIDSSFTASSETVDVYVTEKNELTAFTLNDTGVTTCANYDFENGAHDNQIDCQTLVPEAMPNNQDAHFGRDVDNNDNSNGRAGFDFTKIAADGQELSANASNWACVLDNTTGLMWERKQNSTGIHGFGAEFFYFDSNYSTNGGIPGVILKDEDTREPILNEEGNVQVDKGECLLSETICLSTEEFAAETNTENLCGYSDWRLPTKTELLSIVDYNADGGVAVDTDYFKYTQPTTYITSTGIGEKRMEDLYETRKVAIVNFASGESFYFNKAFVGNSTLSRRQPAILVRVDSSSPLHAHGDIINGVQTFDSVCNGFETKLYPGLPLDDDDAKMYCSNITATDESCPDNHKGTTGASAGKCCAYTVETRLDQADRAIWASGDENEVLDVELGSCCSSAGCRGLSNGSVDLDALAQ